MTVMVNDLVGPSQVIDPFSKCGVTVIVAVTGLLVLFRTRNGEMLPLPVAERPMDGVSLIHV